MERREVCFFITVTEADPRWSASGSHSSPQNLRGADVPPVSFDIELRRVAETAMDLQALAGDYSCDFAREPFRHRRFSIGAIVGVDGLRDH